jgi:hypothetical protein
MRGRTVTRAAGSYVPRFEEGLGALEEYLRTAARFDAWLRQRGLLPPR